MEQNTKENKKGFTRRVGRVALVGPANAGKSTLLNALMGTKMAMVSSKPQSTRQRVLGVKTTDSYQLVFLDTPGLMFGKNVGRKKKGEMTQFLSYELEQALIDLDVLALVVDAPLCFANQNMLKNILENFKRVLAEVGIAGPDIVVLNKVDAFDSKLLLPLISAASGVCGELFPDHDIEFVPTSGRTGLGVPEFLNVLSEKMDYGPELFPEEVETTLDDKAFAAEIIREKAFSLLHKEIPYGLAVVCNEWRSSENIETIHADIIVEKESHKPIVLGQKGSVLQKIGSRARIELESLFECKINLQLHVRVEKDWTLSSKGLQKVGYVPLT